MNELDLFTEALSRTDPAERAAFLDQAWPGTPSCAAGWKSCWPATRKRRTRSTGRPLYAGEFGATVEQPTPFSTGASPPEARRRRSTIPIPMRHRHWNRKARTPDDRVEEARTGRGHSDVCQLDPDATTAAERRPRRAARVATDERVGTVIAGRYTLVEVIGEGGMGSVYLASQTEPVKRQVALKLIKTGMDSRGVLARFDAERQALALMDHPNIARIYDGGLTPAGQPFFVMELVKGVPLTDTATRSGSR